MAIENLTENLILVTLPDGPTKEGALISLQKVIAKNNNCDVIIDCSEIELLNSADIGRLIKIHNYLAENGHRFTLCSVAFHVRCVFTVVGVEKLFDFAKDKDTALQNLQPK